MLCLIYYSAPRKCSMKCLTSVVFDLLQGTRKCSMTCLTSAVFDLLQGAQEVFNEVCN